MGRKPNQLVTEYFDRGAKLADNSNRYVHTCRACGKRFPKGRIEGLIAHIEKNCPSIRREDRIRILSQPNPALQHLLHGNSDPFGAQAHAEHQPTLPVTSSRSLTGLEALAEASRQLEHPAKPGLNQPLQTHLIDPNLDQAYSNLRSSRLGTSFEAHDIFTNDHEAVINGGFGLSHITPARPQVAPEALPSAHEGLQDPTALSLIAADASDLEARLLRDGVEHPDDKLVIDPEVSDSHQAGVGNLPTKDPVNKNFPGPIGSTTSGQHAPLIPQPLPNPLPIECRDENGTKGQNRYPEKFHVRAQKLRGKFTDSRRQEVQEMRKKGACIRCRMLRKTCSGDNPCRTCASVISARVWKLDCMRTSIYKELDIFSTGLFRKMATRLAERRGDPLSEPGRCFIKFADTDSDIGSMSFSAQLYGRKDEQDEMADHVSTKLLSYMQAIIFQPGHEKPPLLRGRSLRVAAESNDKLLARSLDLWSLTQVVVSSPDSWQISLTPPTISSNNQPLHQAITPEVLTSASLSVRQTITAQLQAAAEQRASDLSKNVMVELERRLERKERCQGFETFFVGIILLNCVERMAWAFRRANLMKEWPLGKPAEHYLDQAGRFADFLSNLFQMRGILLNVRHAPEDGILLASSGNAENIDQWLKELRLTGQMLEERKTAEFDPSNYRCYDFRFASRMLLLGG